MSEILDKSVEQHYLCKECLKTLSARTDIVEEGHTLSHQLKRSVLHMAREGITATGIARICHCSPSSVIRIIDEAVELKSRVARLPENLCFDEFRSVNSTMSFICSNCASGRVCGQNPFFESVLKFRFPVTKKPG